MKCKKKKLITCYDIIGEAVYDALESEKNKRENMIIGTTRFMKEIKELETIGYDVVEISQEKATNVEFIGWKDPIQFPDEKPYFYLITPKKQ